MQNIEKVFLSLALFFGLVLIFLNPPFQSPDEPEHFFRIYGYSQGKILAEYRDNRSGLVLPKSFVKFKNLYAPLQGNPFSVTSGEIFKQAGKIKLERENTAFYAFNLPSYLPVAYFPFFLIMKLLLFLKLPPLIMLYILRISELFLYTGLMWLAIRITPVKKPLFTSLALVPMFLYMAGSVNTDTFIVGLSFILSAYLFRLAYDSSIAEIKAKDTLIVSALLFLIILSKPAYLPMALLFLMVPKEKFSGSFGKFKMFLIALGASLLAFFIFFGYGLYVFSSGLTTSLPVQSGSAGQENHIILVILSHPFYFLNQIFTTLVLQAGYYCQTFIGYFGWLDAPLPVYMIIYYIVFLCLVSLTNYTNENKFYVTYNTRLLFLTVLYLSLILITISSYIIFRKAEPFILGVQGRYFFPIAPVIFMLFCSGILKLLPEKFNKLIFLCSFTGLIVSAYFLCIRFYVTIWF